MNGKVVRTKVVKLLDHRMPHVEAHVGGVFERGDKVVVILESEYDALVEKASMYDGLCK